MMGFSLHQGSVDALATDMQDLSKHLKQTREIAVCVARTTHRKRIIVIFFSPLFLCLSRACLGEMIGSSIHMRCSAAAIATTTRWPLPPPPPPLAAAALRCCCCCCRRRRRCCSSCRRGCPSGFAIAQA
jgi:hypothetical protein